MLEGKGVLLIHAVIIDLVQIDFSRWIVDIMLVRGITRPVSTGSIDLHYHEFVGGKSGRHDVNDLPRDVSTTAQTADNIISRDQSRLELRLRGHSTFCNLASRFGGKAHLISGR